jgi:hypothetical protein
MGNPFSKEFWLGEQSKYKPGQYEFDPGAFSTGTAGAETQHMLRQRMLGRAPSVAEQQMRQGIGRALQASQAMEASGVGISPGLSQRLAGQRAATIMGEGNLAMGQMRAQEQAAAEARMMEWLERERAAQMALQFGQAGERGRIDELLMRQSMANQRPGFGGMLLSAGGQLLGSVLQPGGGGGGGAAP